MGEGNKIFGRSTLLSEIFDGEVPSFLRAVTRGGACGRVLRESGCQEWWVLGEWVGCGFSAFLDLVGSASTRFW